MRDLLKLGVLIGKGQERGLGKSECFVFRTWSGLGKRKRDCAIEGCKSRLSWCTGTCFLVETVQASLATSRQSHYSCPR
jgi:hypothetical protein